MLSQLLEELKFISCIPKNAKPCFVSKTLMFTDEWFVTFRRRLNGEKGERGTIYLRELLNSCDKHYRMCRLDGKLLVEALNKSLSGIQNLIYTYDRDNQIKVSNDYKKCYNKASDLIKEIERNSSNFFSYVPNIITLKTEQKFKSEFKL